MTWFPKLGVHRNYPRHRQRMHSRAATVGGIGGALAHRQTEIAGDLAGDRDGQGLLVGRHRDGLDLGRLDRVLQSVGSGGGDGLALVIGQPVGAGQGGRVDCGLDVDAVDIQIADVNAQ
jgi:hypothetical protein